MDAVELEPDPPPRTPQPQPASVFPAQTPSPETAATNSAVTNPEATDAEATEVFETRSDENQISAIDALFGESQFQEYATGLDQSQNPFVRQAAGLTEPVGVDLGGPAAPEEPPPAISRLQRVLLIVLASALAILVLVALFFVGTRLTDILGPAPTVASPTGTPSPSASPILVLGPVAPGEYPWDDLRGGECIDPFEDAWQASYVVVDCDGEHPAQLVDRGLIPETTPVIGLYPGEEALQAQALTLCRAPGILDPAIAGALTDAIVQVSYPTAEVWSEGGRSYFCFVTRSSGEPLTGDLTLPPVAPPEPPPPAPKQMD